VEPIMEKNKNTNETSRRDFLTRKAASIAAVTAALSPAEARETQAPAVAKAGRRVLGANDRINVAFIGAGMRFQALARSFNQRLTRQKDIELAAVCDVWEPRLKAAQEKTKGKPYRDYREIIHRRDIDGVVISTPDHWHYQMASEAMHVGKDVYLEKPMTYTIEEAAKLNEQVNSLKAVLQVGGSGPSNGLLWKVNEYIKAGKMGKVLWGLISYNRNTQEGMWDYPIPGLGNQHWADAKVNPENLDWKMWLGPAPKHAFSTERYFRWRKFWDYSGGNATDLLYHRLGMMSTMIGFDFPSRATGAGGIYVQKNREVPDTYMTMIEYPGEYAVNMISCMGNQTSVPMTVYGNWGTLQVGEEPQGSDSMGDQNAAPQQSAGRFQMTATIRAERQFVDKFKAANDGKTEVVIRSEPGRELVDDWLDCMRSRGTPVYNALRGYQVMTAIKLGLDSYRQGRVMAFDPVRGKSYASPSPHKEYPPKEA
jgi:predicted dehydrogenase